MFYKVLSKVIMISVDHRKWSDSSIFILFINNSSVLIILNCSFEGCFVSLWQLNWYFSWEPQSFEHMCRKNSYFKTGFKRFNSCQMVHFFLFFPKFGFWRFGPQEKYRLNSKGIDLLVSCYCKNRSENLASHCSSNVYFL